MKKILSTRVLVKICVLTTILLILIIYTIWGNSALMVSMVNISSDRIASAFSNFRIAQVSDLHNAEFGESNTELIELLSEHEPDIIVITGDLIDAGHTDIEIAFDFIKQAVQIAPVYFVTGNHEANFSHYDQFKTGLEASGVTVLEDEAIQLVHNNEMITLIGLSDSDFTIKGDMFNEAPAMVNTKLNSLIDDENSYTILLSHRPELFETYLLDKADDKVGGNADEQPLLGKLRGKGTGQICVQQCARDKGQYNQKHCRPDGDILGSDATEIRCKPVATDRVGSQHAAKCKKYHAKQRPYRAADDLSSNVLPNGHGQSQHQVPALAQQAVKLLNFNKKADGEHNKKAYGRCQCQQGHGDPGQRQPVGGVLDKMAQNIGKNVQHKHARRNGQNNTACGFELIT